MLNPRQLSAITASILLTFSAGRASAQATQPALTFGSPAPVLALTHWYKGTPFKTFEPGKVYVVEFWATWCGPCRKSIPHLTELQKKYQDKITFIGVDVWEHPEDETDASIAALAKPFVDQMGATMAYHVAGDGAAGTMAKTWLEPAKQPGIPTAFVIDGKGRIAWIGHPDALESVLEQVTAGTWDVVAERKKADAARFAAENEPETKATAKIIAARKAGDNATVLATLDEIDATLPNLAANPDLISVRLQALMQTDAAKSVAYVQKLTAPGGAIARKPDFVWSITRIVPDQNKYLLTQADWKAVATAVDPMIWRANDSSGAFFSAYASLLKLAGKRDLAAFYQRSAVDRIMAYQNKPGAKVTKASADYLKSEQAKLDDLTQNAG